MDHHILSMILILLITGITISLVFALIHTTATKFQELRVDVAAFKVKLEIFEAKLKDLLPK